MGMNETFTLSLSSVAVDSQSIFPDFFPVQIGCIFPFPALFVVKPRTMGSPDFSFDNGLSVNFTLSATVWTTFNLIGLPEICLLDSVISNLCLPTELGMYTIVYVPSSLSVISHLPFVPNPGVEALTIKFPLPASEQSTVASICSPTVYGSFCSNITLTASGLNGAQYLILNGLSESSCLFANT